jgi:hypothetical protein
MPQTLPEMVRSKYPGVYDDISDVELDAKVRAKYPGQYDDLPSPAVTSTKPEAKMSAAIKGTAYGTDRAGQRAYDLGPDPLAGKVRQTLSTPLAHTGIEMVDEQSTPSNLIVTAATLAMAAERAAALPAKNVLLKAKAAMGAVAETAAPVIKYEVAKAGLEHVGVPSSLAAVIAMGVSGYRSKGKGPVETPPVAAQAPAGATAPVEPTPATPKEPIVQPAPSSATPPATPVKTPAGDTVMLGKADRTAGQMSSAWVRNDIGKAARRIDVTLTSEMADRAMELVKQGASPAEAVASIADPAAVLAARLGLPSAADAEAAVAARNRTGRWAGSPSKKQIVAKGDAP